MRHFIALMLEPELGGQLQGLLGPGPAGLDELGRAHPGAVRLHATEDLHLTLAFLGEFPAERRPALAQTLARALAPLAAPHLRIVAPGAFPERGRERVLWAGVEEPGRAGGGAGDLADLAAAVRGACTQHGVALDPRPFRPHVTLARLRAAARGQVPDAFYDQNPGLEWKPTGARWVVSLGTGGPRAYRPEDSFPLAPHRDGGSRDRT